MTATNLLDAHVRQQNALDKALFLGRLAWYSIPECRVSHAQVVQSLTSVGLGLVLPQVPKDFDIFRRVSTQAAKKKVPVANVPGVFENFLVREVAGRGEDIVTRRIVAERIDRKAKKLDYNVDLFDIEFNKATAVITIKQLSQTAEPTAHAITQEIQQEFLAQRQMLNAYAIREFVRKLLLGWGATCVRDGVYFVAEDMAAEVEKLEQMVNGLPNDAFFHSMPLIDDGKQREMVKRAFQIETADAIDAQMTEINEIHASGKEITIDRYSRILSDFQNLTKKTEGYRELLDVELGETDSRLLLFQTAVVQLRAKVKDTSS